MTNYLGLIILIILLVTLLFSRIELLRSLRIRSTKSCLRTIYISFNRSELEYYIEVWDGFCTVAQQLTPERLQLEFIRIFMGMTPYCSSEYLYLESSLSAFEEHKCQH